MLYNYVCRYHDLVSLTKKINERKNSFFTLDKYTFQRSLLVLSRSIFIHAKYTLMLKSMPRKIKLVPLLGHSWLYPDKA